MEKSLAWRLSDKYGTTDPFRIARELKIKIIYFSAARQKGFSQIISRNVFIYINQNLSPAMQRMVCAHELGHALLHKEYLKSGKEMLHMELFDMTNITEYEANVFAAELLIDEDKMYELFREGYGIAQVASCLGININLLLIRLYELQKKSHLIDLPMIPDPRFLGKIEDVNEEYR